MATLADSTLLSSNSSAAIFRQWASFYAAAFALGWTDTAAIGQIDLTSVAAPGALNTSMGFKVYAMADALQATVPVFCKIEFGSAAAAIDPAIWLTIGTTHNGSGTLGGILLTRIQLNGISTAATVYANSYASAASNRITVAPWTNGVSTSLWFGIERTKDSTGADTNVGLLYCAGWAQGSGAGAIVRSQYLPFTGTIPNSTFGFHIILSQTTPSTLNGNVGISAVIPVGYDAKQPGMNFLVGLVNDFAAYADVPVTVYGAARTYKQAGANISSLRAGAVAAGGVDANTRLFMRYE